MTLGSFVDGPQRLQQLSLLVAGAAGDRRDSTLAVRPVAADQGGSNEVTIVGDLLAPILEKLAGGTEVDPARLHFLSVRLGTLVDLYLVTADAGERSRLRQEIVAHMLLALDRVLSPPPAASRPST